jgi:hypothetical protein
MEVEVEQLVAEVELLEVDQILEEEILRSVVHLLVLDSLQVLL